MTTALDTLVTPMTVDEAKTAIYDALAAQGVVTTSWKPGAVVRTIIAALAIVLAGLSWVQSQLARMGFLDLAEGDWLTAVAYYVYGVTRIQATFATGTVNATNSGAGVYSGAAGDLILASSVTGKSYRATAAWSIGAGAVDVSIPVEAVESGSASSVDAGDLDTLTTTLSGVTVTNPAALVGADVEGDAALRLRCRESLGALSPNGPKDAYAYFARSAVRADGTSIGVTRVRTIADGLGGVTVYVATGSGGVTGTSGNPATDLGAIQTSINENVEPIAITAVAVSAAALTVAVTYELWLRDSTGLTTAQVETLVSAALSAALSDAPIGGEVISPATGKVYVDTLEAAIVGALPAASVIRVDVTVPAADVAVAVSEAPVAGTITPTAVTFVSRATE